MSEISDLVGNCNHQVLLGIGDTSKTDGTLLEWVNCANCTGTYIMKDDPAKFPSRANYDVVSFRYLQERGQIVNIYCKKRDGEHE